MSLSNEIEDSLQACQEIEKKFTDEDGMLIVDPGKERPEVLDRMDYKTAQEEMAEETPEETEAEVPEEASEETGEETAGEVPEEKEEETVREVPEEKKEEIIEETAQTDTEEVAEKSVAERHPVLKTMLSIAVCIFSALVLSLLVTKYVAHHTSVEGSSMEPSLSDGDQIIVENVSYYLHSPERFDVVVFPTKEGVSYIKRVIGLPGEAVWIYDGQIYINGELLIEEYGNESLEDPGVAAAEVQLGEDEYFVLGDNRNASIDSRQIGVGTVHREDIKGKAWFRFLPFKKMGTIQ